MVIGDFPKNAARQYLEERLRELRSRVQLDDDNWDKVFEVRGCWGQGV